jgi:hypothetical protein
VTTRTVLVLLPTQYKPKKEYYGEEKHEESYSAPKKEYYKEEKHEESYQVSRKHTQIHAAVAGFHMCCYWSLLCTFQLNVQPLAPLWVASFAEPSCGTDTGSAQHPVT